MALCEYYKEAVFKPYEKPELLQPVQLKPGHVIEAITESNAATSSGRFSDPTGIFGYYVGQVSQPGGRYTPGVRLTEQLLDNLNCVEVGPTYLQHWTKLENVQVELYLVVGEIQDLNVTKAKKARWENLDYMRSNYVLFGQDDIKSIREQLLEFRDQRTIREYHFVPKELRPHTLKEVLASLE